MTWKREEIGIGVTGIGSVTPGTDSVPRIEHIRFFLSFQPTTTTIWLLIFLVLGLYMFLEREEQGKN